MTPIERAVIMAQNPDGLWEKLGGILFLERLLFTLRRAGFSEVWISLPKPSGALRLPEGLNVQWTNGSSSSRTPRPPFAILSDSHVWRPEELRRAVSEPNGRPLTYKDDAGRPVMRILAEEPGDLFGETSRESRVLPPGAALFVKRPLGRRENMDWLLSSGRKSQDGFMARHFDRRISLALSRRLLDTKVTPNQMTVFSCALGLLGAACLAVPSRAWRTAGALLIWLHSVVDGCDGELARIRFQESARGKLIDFWGDNLVHAALFSGLGWGLAKTLQTPLPLFLGLAAAAAGLASAFIFSSSPSRKDQPALARLESSLAARDFIYLLVVLAVLDWTYPFLWASALGSVLFLALTIYLRRSQRE